MCGNSPGLTWFSMMKYTGVRLKYFKKKTEDMLEFFESGVRGGVSTVLGCRYVKCNNKITNDAFDNYKQITKAESDNLIKIMNSGDVIPEDIFYENYVKYYDANSLYPWAMMQPMPNGEMYWAKLLSYTRSDPVTFPDEETELNVDHKHTTTGYVYEVDLEYPIDIKDKTRYFSFCPEKVIPNVNAFSEWQQTHKNPRYRPTKKLLLQQTNKTNYIVEGRMLD